MARRLFTDNANSALAAGISSTATALSLTSGGGALFPNPNTALGQNFTFTLVKNGNTAIYEVCNCTQRSTDTFAVITRGLEGTTALSWNAGDYVYKYPTAGDMQQFQQADDVQANQTNFAVDTGTANAYVAALTPALLALTSGMQIRVLTAHANTGASTINVSGLGAESIVLPGGTALPAGSIPANSVMVIVWNATESWWELSGVQSLTAYLTAATAAATYAPLVNAHLTGVPTVPTAAPGTNTTQAASTAFANEAANEQYTTGIPGSVQWPNGFIENWGVILTPASSPTTASFELPFTTKIFSIQATCLNSFQELFVEYPYSSLSGFTLGFGAGGQYVAWRAIGY
jgi:hypothetical protein